MSTIEDADLVWALVRAGGPEAVAALDRISQQIANEAVVDELLQLADRFERDANTYDPNSVSSASRMAHRQAVSDVYRLRSRVTELRASKALHQPT